MALEPVSVDNAETPRYLLFMDKTDSIFWIAALDGDLSGGDRRKTRSAAERDATWLRAHPARRDRFAFGLGGDVSVIRVMENEWTGEWIEVRQ